MINYLLCIKVTLAGALLAVEGEEEEEEEEDEEREEGEEVVEVGGVFLIRRVPMGTDLFLDRRLGAGGSAFKGTDAVLHDDVADGEYTPRVGGVYGVFGDEVANGVADGVEEEVGLEGVGFGESIISDWLVSNDVNTIHFDGEE